MNNKKEFLELIERYESITLEEIQSNWVGSFFSARDTAFKLTGFGDTNTCSLCIPISAMCYYCTHLKVDDGEDNCPCMTRSSEAWRTYTNIQGADTPERLLEAFRDRAKYLKSIIQ